MTDTITHLTDSEIVAQGRKVTWIGFGVNAVLAFLKIIAGIFGRSTAMLADGVHSLSDFVTDVIVIVFMGLSRRKANSKYSYGHGKYETFATMIVSFFLIVVAIGFFVDGAQKIWDSIHGHEIARPGMVALVMAVISIASKEILFHYTRYVGRQINSQLIIANAWHHRSDALSSVATLLGIAGAMFLGPSWRILDPLAAMLVSVFIVIVSIKLAAPAIKELLEASLPPDLVKQIDTIVANTKGVKSYHKVRSRRNGNTDIVDLHIQVDPDITVKQGHDIATDCERHLKKLLGKSAIINIHVEPYHSH
ncbi:MAG: cation diffusion facilitator family transporter [Muribaculaceae bacterium]|nr:cation diffusion facilitator family transporter [Muribaculaceae bacterium]